jgi:nitronate monooxygenase
VEFLNKIKLIQGGMGVFVSTWRLARAVAMERPGITAGTVSGTGIDVVYVRLLQLGDPGGHIRRALAAFDAQFGVDMGKKIIDRYFLEGGKAPTARFKSAPRQTVRAQDGSNVIPLPAQQAGPVSLSLDEDVVELLIAAGFAEVWLAKQGHSGKVFINFLYKIELPLVYTMYGAMLASVDGIIVGAGNPDGLPAVRSRLVDHGAVAINLSVLYRESGETFSVPFDPRLVAGGKLAEKPLPKPAFLAIVSLENGVQGLAQSASEPPDGFIIEHHTAGGHNAGPLGPVRTDEKGQPLYSDKDDPDVHAIHQVGLPFWLAGGYGSKERLQYALDAGATGVQVGSNFALAQESGMKPAYRTAILEALKRGADDATMVHTTLFSPTGFPFKVVQLDDTVANTKVYAARPRVCDLGLLQRRTLSKPAADGTRRLYHRCRAEPVSSFVNKRGLERNTSDQRCLCNGLISCAGLGQIRTQNGHVVEEPAIVTLGQHLDGIRRLSRQGQSTYWVRDVVADILG